MVKKHRKCEICHPNWLSKDPSASMFQIRSMRQWAAAEPGGANSIDEAQVQPKVS